MKIASISDVHVKVPFDKADELLMSFLKHPLVQEADYVLLLGDIFDLMCGPHEQYLSMYQHIFREIDLLQKKGKKIFFFEGNHDVHVGKLFEKIWKNGEVFVTQVPVVEVISGKMYYFSHGDEHEIDNKSYHRYIKLIRSAPLRFVANHLMPFAVLNYFGERASKMSRKKGSKKFDAEDVKTRFRYGVELKTRGVFDFVLGGHSHVQDLYKILEGDSVYINNGYALQSKSFIFIENHKARFESLS